MTLVFTLGLLWLVCINNLHKDDWMLIPVALTWTCPFSLADAVIYSVYLCIAGILIQDGNSVSYLKFWLSASWMDTLVI